VRLLPRKLPIEQLQSLVSRDQPGITIGINETHLAPVVLDFATEPHLFALGDAECGKTNLLRLIGRGLIDRYTANQARLFVVDYRRTLLGTFKQDYVLDYAASAQTLAEMVPDLRASLSRRLPGPDVTPDQLRDRGWWQGPDVYVLVDDYDLVSSPSGNPLTPLVDLLPQARDIGLHLVITRRVGGAARALFEPVLQRMRELDSPGLLMSGNREEGVLIGNMRASAQPPGRGTLVRRRDGNQLIQTAWCER
jgi:S-DNA-T family DNA segregation ATPase FtsK/SpoIIIE